MKAKKEFQRV